MLLNVLHKMYIIRNKIFCLKLLDLFLTNVTHPITYFSSMLMWTFHLIFSFLRDSDMAEEEGEKKQEKEREKRFPLLHIYHNLHFYNNSNRITTLKEKWSITESYTTVY